MASNETQIVISARDEASNVLRGINQQFDAMKAPISSLQGAVAGLGAAFAGLSVVTSIKGALTMADDIGKLAQKTGIAVESFSKLSYAAKLSDVSNEQLATGLKKLSQNMTEAAAGTGQVQKYFQALGVSVTDGAGKLKGADAVMGELAGKFAGMEDGAAKTATAMAIFGKSGADLIPLLNAGSDGLESMADEAKRLGLVMSTDMAKGAETFNDNLTKLTAASQGLSITLGNEMLPWLTATTNAMVEAAKEGGLLKAVWVGLGGLGAAMFTNEFASPEKKIKALQQDIMDMQRHLPDVGPGSGLLQKWLFGSEAELNAGISNARAQIKALEQEVATANQAGDKAAKEKSEAAKKAAEETEARLRKLLQAGSGSGAAKAIESDYSKLNKQLSEQIALADASLKSTTKLTEGEKLQAKVMADIVNGRVKLSAAQKQNIDASLKELVTKQNLNIANETARKLAKESIDAKEKETAESFKHAAAINDEAIKQEEANSVYGQGKAALEDLATAKLEAKLASIDYAAASFEEIDALEKEIAARKRLATAMRSGEIKDANAKAAQDAAREWQKSADEINRSLTDALMRGFESGKGFGQNLVDTLKNMFNTMVLRPIISAIINPVSGAVTAGMTSMMGGTAQAGGMDYLGMTSNGMSMNSLYQSGASYLTADAGIASGMTYGTNIGSQQSMMLAGQESGLTAASGSMAAYGGAALGAYYGYQEHGAGGAAVYGTAGYVGGAALAGGVAAAGGGAAAAGAGAMAGGTAALAAIPVWGWAALAALAIFGWDDSNGNADHVGAPTNFWTDYTAGADGISAGSGPESNGPSFGYQAIGGRRDGGSYGGWEALSSEQTAAIDASVALIFSQFETYADTLGLSSEAMLATTVSSGVLGESGAGADSSATLEEAVLKSFNNLSDQLSLALIPNLADFQLEGESLSATFGRVSFETASVNAILGTVGQSLNSTGLDAINFSESMIQAAGGLQNLSDMTRSYYQNFYSQEEQLADSWQSLDAVFATLGVSTPQTKDEFRGLVDALDLSTAAGQSSYLSLMSVSGAFSEVVAATDAAAASAVDLAASTKAATDAASSFYDDAQSGLDAAFSRLTQSIAAEQERLAGEYDYQVSSFNDQIASVTTSVGKLKTLSSSLSSTLDGMRVIGSDGAYRQDAQAQISAALNTARSGGGLPVDGQLTEALRTVSQPSEGLFSSFEDYARDFYRTANDISALNDLTSDQLSADETTQALLESQLKKLADNHKAEMARLDQSLDLYQAQLDAMIGIDNSVISVESAIAGLTSAMLSMAGASVSAAQAGLITPDSAITSVQDSGVAKDQWATLSTATGQQDVWTSSGGAVGVRTLSGVDIYTASGTNFTDTEAINHVNALEEQGNEMQIYLDAIKYGVSAKSLDALMGWAAGTSNEWANTHGFPSFAVGTNYVPSDMTANIHEGERIIPAADNRVLMDMMIGGRDNDALVAEIRALRAEVAGLRESAERGNVDAKRSADALHGQQGVPFLVELAT